MTRYWLMKSEPSEYSIHDLKAEPHQTACWDGVRNYQARNFMRDEMSVGDGVLFYHSNADPPGVVGTARVSREAYPDATQFDPEDPHHDPKATEQAPRWFMVDIRFERVFPRTVPLAELKQTPGLENMPLVRKGSRLSIMPVSPEEWRIIHRLAGAE
jgi:predicted RNA-binding protein with PUA-like domain